METVMVLALLVFVIGLAALPVWLVRRKKWKDTPKEERKAQTRYALIVLGVLFVIVFIRQTMFNNAKDDILRDTNTSQSQLSDTEYRQNLINDIATKSPSLTRADAECVARVLEDEFGLDGLKRIDGAGNSPYTSIVKANMRSHCQVELQ